jgi:hypothetical protein
MVWLFAAPPAWAQIEPSATTTYYACVTTATGAVRIIGSSTVCKSTERKIHWNQTGPQGPPGISDGTFSLLEPGLDPVLGSAARVFLQTSAATVSGYYFVSISALLYIDAGDGGAFCYDTLASTGHIGQVGGSELVGGHQQASITDTVFLNVGDSVQLWCYSFNGDGKSFLYNAGMTLTLINSFSADITSAMRPAKHVELPRPRH